ncbi:hypothetical protein J3E69DRAFT_258879 [Trichoderma sp. SZMC 28015]
MLFCCCSCSGICWRFQRVMEGPSYEYIAHRTLPVNFPPDKHSNSLRLFRSVFRQGPSRPGCFFPKGVSRVQFLCFSSTVAAESAAPVPVLQSTCTRYFGLQNTDPGRVPTYKRRHGAVAQIDFLNGGMLHVVAGRSTSTGSFYSAPYSYIQTDVKSFIYIQNEALWSSQSSLARGPYMHSILAAVASCIAISPYRALAYMIVYK